MRRQLALTVAAIAALIVLAFLVPLAILIRSIAEDRALNAAERSAQTLAPVLATVTEPAAVDEVVTGINAGDVGTITVFLPDGTVLGEAAAADANVALAARGRAFSTGAPGGQQVLVPVASGADTTVIRVFVPDADLRRGVAAAWALLAALGVTLVLLAVAVADRLARSMVRPIGELAEVADQLSHGDLHARVTPAGPPEISEVGHTINQLAGRIEALLAAEREAAADLSHRLRTPVTALRVDVDGLRDAVERERLTADVDELTRAVDRLIDEARRPVREGLRAESDLTTVASERVAFWAALADEQGRSYSTSLPDGPCPVGVAPDDLEAVLDALLGNVIAHTPEGGGFRVYVTHRIGGGGRLVVEDDGNGFADDAVLARGRSGGGSTGLGLDIVRATAEASRGGVALGRGPHGGGRVEVDFGGVAEG